MNRSIPIGWMKFVARSSCIEWQAIARWLKGQSLPVVQMYLWSGNRTLDHGATQPPFKWKSDGGAGDWTQDLSLLQWMLYYWATKSQPQIHYKLGRWDERWSHLTFGVREPSISRWLPKSWNLLSRTRVYKIDQTHRLRLPLAHTECTYWVHLLNVLTDWKYGP